MAVNYDLYLEAEVHSVRQTLPGHIRQRLRRTIDALAGEPRPTTSRALDVSHLVLPAGVEIRRIRLDRWRMIYAVYDDGRWVWVLAVRRRPPYDYEDLTDLAARMRP